MHPPRPTPEPLNRTAAGGPASARSAPSGPPSAFRGRFLTDPDDLAPWAAASGPYGFMPAAVAVPRDAEDVARLVEWAAARDFPVVPRGAGTGMPGHNVGTGVVLDLSTLDTVDPVDEDRHTIRVGPGAVAAAVAREADRAGLYFPCLPSSADRCTVGGMVANNAAGARSFRHGAVRYWVQELTVVLADGSTATVGTGRPLPVPLKELHEDLLQELGPTPEGWPSVRKNSSGYALDHFLPGGDAAQLIVGSEGTLGIVTSVLLRLTERPLERVALLAGLPDLDRLPDIAHRAAEVGASACEYFGRRILEMADLAEDPEVGPLARGAEGLVLLEMEGSEEEVEEGLPHLRSVAGAHGGASIIARDLPTRERLWHVRHLASPTIARAAERGLRSVQFIEDCVVPLPRLPRFVRGLRGILAGRETDAVIFGHAGDGNLHVNPLLDVGRTGWRDGVRTILEETADLVADCGGTLSGEHGDGRVRAPFLERIWGSRLTAAFRRVKETLDPRGILNPGVVVPLPDQDPLEGLRPHR